jgi:hypothetical protein
MMMTCGRRPLRTGVPMAAIRSQVVLQAFTNKVEDRYVNTFHFFNNDTYAVHQPVVAAALSQFFIGTATGGTTGPGANLAPCVSRTVTVNHYDLAQPEPRIPTTQTITLPTAVSTSNLPQELAVVLSFRGSLPIHPRRRGRIFFGPLANHADNLSPGSSGAFSFVGAILRQRLVEHAKDLRNNSLAGWAVRSEVPAINYVAIDAGYVDDAFDIQRRRGHETTVRTVFSQTLP